MTMTTTRITIVIGGVDHDEGCVVRSRFHILQNYPFLITPPCKDILGIQKLVVAPNLEGAGLRFYITCLQTPGVYCSDRSSISARSHGRVTRALCILNRIMVATQTTGGISALYSFYSLSSTDRVVQTFTSWNRDLHVESFHGGKGGNKSLFVNMSQQIDSLHKNVVAPPPPPPACPLTIMSTKKSSDNQFLPTKRLSPLVCVCVFFPLCRGLQVHCQDHFPNLLVKTTKEQEETDHQLFLMPTLDLGGGWGAKLYNVNLECNTEKEFFVFVLF